MIRAGVEMAGRTRRPAVATHLHVPEQGLSQLHQCVLILHVLGGIQRVAVGPTSATPAEAEALDSVAADPWWWRIGRSRRPLAPGDGSADCQQQRDGLGYDTFFCESHATPYSPQNPRLTLKSHKTSKFTFLTSALQRQPEVLYFRILSNELISAVNLRVTSPLLHLFLALALLKIGADRLTAEYQSLN